MANLHKKLASSEILQNYTAFLDYTNLVHIFRKLIKIFPPSSPALFFGAATLSSFSTTRVAVLKLASWAACPFPRLWAFQRFLFVVGGGGGDGRFSKLGSVGGVSTVVKVEGQKEMGTEKVRESGEKEGGGEIL